MATTTSKRPTHDDVRSALERFAGLEPKYKDLILETLALGWIVSLKVWMGDRNKLVVNTLQVEFDSNGQVKNAWWPGPRLVEVRGASFVELGGSKRNYRGVVCLAATHAGWVGSDDTGTILVYLMDGASVATPDE